MMINVQVMVGYEQRDREAPRRLSNHDGKMVIIQYHDDVSYDVHAYVSNDLGENDEDSPWDTPTTMAGGFNSNGVFSLTGGGDSERKLKKLDSVSNLLGVTLYLALNVTDRSLR